MRFVIKHEIRGRIRVHVLQKRMTYEQADTLYYYLNRKQNVTSVKVYERSQDVTVSYVGNREEIIRLLKQFSYETTEVPDAFLQNSGRQLNDMYWEKLVNKVVLRGANKLFLPYTLRAGITIIKSIRYIWQGIQTLMKGKIEVPVLDATAIGVSIFRSDFNTAGSVMFLLGIGELLEEWTHKKSVGDLARSMSLNIDKVWVDCDGQEVWIPSSEVKKGDRVIVHMGNMIPFDGVVEHGEAMVNQASMTGESAPVHKKTDSYVYAGTVVEEGGITLRVEAVGGSSRFEKIVQMIEESEKLKSSLESKASHLADRLVPYTLAGTGLVWLFTRNVTKALSILMVDFSCALKLAMPISVLSAIREASLYQITVKGGKYLEAVAEADTIVFDKTGTLTKGEFKVSGINAVGCSEKELLEVAAYSESYSTHPIAESIKNAYGEKIDTSKLQNVEEIAGHGIHAQFAGKDVFVGNEKLMNKQNISYEKCDAIGTIIYVAIDGKFAGSLVISDEIKEGAKEAIADMKHVGVKKTVMLSGDQKEIVERVANELGIDEYHAQLLPADKVDRVEKLLEQKNEKDKVAFVGDGINDAPVLTRADIGIAMGSMGSDAAIEAADVVLMKDKIESISDAIRISRKTNKILWQNIIFSLFIKVVVMILVVAGLTNMWAAVFADVGVTLLAVLNSMRIIR